MPLVRPCPALAASDHDAVIFDMDGVVTDTAHIHALAWKETFDAFLARNPRDDGTPRPAFDVEHDYLTYVDGRQREDGLRGFLASRGIKISEGSSEDPATAETVHGLARKKNERYLELLRRDGPQVFSSTVQLIATLRDAGLRIALITASRNAIQVLKAANVIDLFEVRVDGNEMARLGLEGKPRPDIFLEAARRLGVAPERCVVIEDALAGVEAGRRGGFGLVIGVDRTGRPSALLDHGADLVVGDLSQLFVDTDRSAPRATIRPGGGPVQTTGRASAASDQAAAAVTSLPSALDAVDALLHPATGRVALFFDYDGTLTPIVRHPDLALLSEPMRGLLERLGARLPLAILSGRDLDDVRDQVAVQQIWYAGSHGFEMQDPRGGRQAVERAEPYVAHLHEAADRLEQALVPIEGAWVERKRFAVAVHYREVVAGAQDRVRAVVENVHTDHHDLRLKRGKKIFEFQPDVPWDKGAALQHVAAALGLDLEQDRILYFGDDRTDEDAFAVLRGPGAGILVRDPDEEPGSTVAQYVLDGPHGVQRFLELALQALEGKSA